MHVYLNDIVSRDGTADSFTIIFVEQRNEKEDNRTDSRLIFLHDIA